MLGEKAGKDSGNCRCGMPGYGPGRAKSAMRRKSRHTFEPWLQPPVKIVSQAIDDDEHDISTSPVGYAIDDAAIGLGKVDLQDLGDSRGHIQLTDRRIGIHGRSRIYLDAI